MPRDTSNKKKQLIAFRDTAVKKLQELERVAKASVKTAELRTEFKIRYKHLDSIYSEFHKQHNALLGICSTETDADLDALNGICTDFDNRYFHIQTVYHDIFEVENNSETFTNRNPSNIKLPKIELPKFSGDPKQWKSFIDMFRTTIHDNLNLSNIEKFNYLISSLKNEPLSLVQCNPLTSDNYPIAFKALVERYENKRLLATAHWQAIDNSPKININQVTAHSLRNLLNIFSENLAALANLKFPVKEWDWIILQMLLKRLDPQTVTRFELENCLPNVIPTYESLKQFVLKQCSALENISTPVNNRIQKNTSYQNNHRNNSHAKPSSSFLINTPNIVCSFCNSDHLIYKCPSFLSKTPQDRFTLVKNNKWCVNCLGSKHNIKDCASTSTCRECKRKHHTLLHFNNGPEQPMPSCSSQNDNTQNNSVNSLTNLVPCNTTILLSTVLIEILDKWGNYQTARALLDPGSQANFLTTKCANRLGLSRAKVNLSVHGLGQSSSTLSLGTTCTFRPRGKVKPTFTIDAAILPKICDNMPTAYLDSTLWPHISRLDLADPEFNKSSEIDVLLNADIFSLIVENDLVRGNVNEPTAIKTAFGYILMGKTSCASNFSSNALLCSLGTSLDDTIKKFWELEQVPNTLSISPEDLKCEEIYSSNVARTESGRFVVALPFRDEEPSFINSKEQALRRFYSLERRLLSNKELHDEYCAFMKDYLVSNHMKLDPSHFLSTHNEYYIPHHCITRPNNVTTKLRVVFDASAKCNGKSLNDTLLTGPKLQQDIASILLNFRLHKFVLIADIKQMYRQILIKPSHQNYQKILWRFTPQEPIQSYTLLTVTYGVSSAPFLAIRTLHQLATEEKHKFPLACSAILSHTYVDDIVTGTSSFKAALTLKKELIDLFKLGGFELRKWASNNTHLLSDLPESDLYSEALSFDTQDENCVIKILGLQWQPTQDSFSYKVDLIKRPCTKRTILSEIARIFDPLGFLAPLTFFAKTLIQHLWCAGLDWDEMPPIDIVDKWSRYITELPLISNISLPRFLLSDHKSIQLHGFCDGSEKGYAAAIYFRVLTQNDDINTYLLCSKTKVAPLKRISIPRIELCGAVLLADLFEFVMNTFEDKVFFESKYAWTDSTVVLSWINSSPHKFKTFVSNRISHIQDKVSPQYWYHVDSKNNPADCASRGLLPTELINHSLWWAGPNYLKNSIDSWPKTTSIHSIDSEAKSEERKITLINANAEPHILDSLINKFSSLNKLKDVLAYIFRFIHNLKNPLDKLTGKLSFAELSKAQIILIRHTQESCFSAELHQIKIDSLLPKVFRKLNPFLDKDGLLRVGGRLKYSQLNYDAKHPILLPRSHPLTYLIIDNFHKTYLHCGLQTLQFLLMQQFWIFSSRRAIRTVLSKCLTCWKVNPTNPQPPMAPLPSQRITQAKPFSVVGVDYGGPFSITLGKTRGAKTSKAYICLFICFATKAVHIELVSDLSSDCFIAALRRFVARRGRCSYIYSDQGTNFVGAYKQLKQCMQRAVECERLQWHLNPPSSPHMGGLWEAGIKSVKSHLIRVIGHQILTYEELLTVLNQIEAILNSRPLYPVSSDPQDLSALTPGHFLFLEPVSSVPDDDLSHLRMNQLSRWQLIQRLNQDFWRRWHAEFLHTLHQRHKWNDPSTPITPGTMVLVKSDLVPPLKWNLGRIESVHPGNDGVTRVVTVRTAQGTFKRPVVKICPLPQC